MKKLLTFLTTFNTLTLSGLSIITCTVSSNEQKIIDNLIDQLKDQKFLVAACDQTILAVEDAIVNHNNFKSLFKDVKVKIKSWRFKKDNIYIDNQFQDNCEYDVILDIESTANKSNEIKAGSVNFQINLKINYNPLQQATLKLEKIKDLKLNVEMFSNENGIEVASIDKVISEFEQLNDYQAAFNNNKISKEKIKLYNKNGSDKTIEITSNKYLVDKADIIIETKLNYGNETRIFRFDTKLFKTIRKIALSTVTFKLQECFNAKYFLVNSATKFSDLNSQIWNLNPLNDKSLDNCQIKYYDQEIEGIDITNGYQKAGKIWVEIIANDNNLFWTKKSELIAVTINKTDLSKIKTLTNDSNTSLKFACDQTKTYKMIEEQIVSATEFKNKPLKSGYQIKYYTWEWFSYKEINQDTEQQPGTIYAEIIASNDDPNWCNHTNNIAINFSKLNLNAIINDFDLNFVVEPTEQYQALNNKILNSTEFTSQALNNNSISEIRYYNQKISDSIINNDYQKPGKIWIEIIIDDDKYNKEKTNRIPVNILRLNLNTIQNLTYNDDFDADLTVNPTKKYCDLTKEILKAQEFLNQATLDNCQIKYYDQEIEGIDITNDYQKAGKIWVEIIANDNNLFWTKKSERIAVTINKTDLSKIKTLTNDSNTSLKFTCDQTKTYKMIEEQIVNATEFKNKPLKSGYKIKYFTWKRNLNLNVFSGDYNEIDQETKQQPGTIYAEIIVSNDDSNWYSKTDKIKIEIV